MNRYRLSLWVENQGDIPDYDIQLQVVGIVPSFPRLVMMAMVLVDCDWVRLAVVEYERGGCWSHAFTRPMLSLSGLRSLYLR